MKVNKRILFSVCDGVKWKTTSGPNLRSHTAGFFCPTHRGGVALLGDQEATDSNSSEDGVRLPTWWGH